MSQFENRIQSAIKSGLNLKPGMYKEQYYIGRFITGWKHPKDCENPRVGHRHIDLKINGKGTLFGVSRPVYVEAQGDQHKDPQAKYHDPEYNQETGDLIWTRAQKFNDQVDRDEHVTIKAQADNAILLLVEEPTYKIKNPAYYSQLDKLIEKLEKPGYLAQIITRCEMKHYKGCIITWDNEKFITPKRKWPKPNYYEGV